MVHIRYSRWTASGGDSLDPESVFDQLNENMNDTGDLQQAMRRLMQKGLKQGEKQTKGIEDLLRKWRARCANSTTSTSCNRRWTRCRRSSTRWSIKSSRRSNRWTSRAKMFRKKTVLERSAGQDQRRHRKLTSYRFENSGAEKDFEQLVMQLEQIRKLENWLRREGSLFRGQTPMDFQQSQEMMERMEDLRKLESQLSSMQLKDVDKDLLEKLLGGDPKQDFEGIMRMQSLLEEGGYVLEERRSLRVDAQRRAPHRPTRPAGYL